MASPVVNLFHLFVVAPALGYVFFENYNGRALSKTAATVALVIVALIAIYHGFLFYTKTFSSAPAGAAKAAASAVQSEDFIKGGKVDSGSSSELGSNTTADGGARLTGGRY